VTIEDNSGKTIYGKLRVENTGLELIYQDIDKSENRYAKASYIFYKSEFQKIQALIRFHDQLSDENKKQRKIQLEKTYHPSALRKLKRKILNLFKTVRDSVAEVTNLLMSRAKKTASIGTTLTSQDKYVTQMKQELLGSVGTSFEPLLERYIGRKVILELIKGDKIFEYSGILKEYTANFLQIMDVDYTTDKNNKPQKADLIVLRKCGFVRHLGE